MLGLIEKADATLTGLFRETGLTKEKFMAALRQVRGNRSVTTNTPEDTCDVLKKYGRELTAAARSQKLDPVIGRDEEIRILPRPVIPERVVSIKSPGPFLYKELYPTISILPYLGGCHNLFVTFW